MEKKEAKIHPNDETTSREVGNQSEKKNDEEFVKVPPYHRAMLHMINGSWLTINDDEETDANRLFVGGNLNLSLICALLFTTYLPLYYSEAQRLNDDNDGLTIDITMGYLAPLVVSRDFIHGIFDCCYLVAAAGTLFGTMVSVFYMLAANEANDDSKTVVLMRFLGPFASQLPYYYFSIGITGWAFAGFFHVFVVPRTGTAFYVKVVILWVMILIMLMVSFPRMVRGIFMGKLESQRHPPVYLSEDEISKKLEEFFSNPKKDGDLSLRKFLSNLTYMTEYGYRPRLQTISEVQATCMYYEKLSEVTGRSIKEVKEAMKAASIK
eukprot:gene9110-9868_t